MEIVSASGIICHISFIIQCNQCLYMHVSHIQGNLYSLGIHEAKCENDFRIIYNIALITDCAFRGFLYFSCTSVYINIQIHMYVCVYFNLVYFSAIHFLWN